MPLVHSFAPETSQCRGSTAAINANFPLFESLGGGDVSGGGGVDREAEDVIFHSADVAFAATERHTDDAGTDRRRRREATVDGAGEDGGHDHRSMGPMPDIVSIAAAVAPSTTTSSLEGFQAQAQQHSSTSANATGGLEEEQLRHDNLHHHHHHYGTENNEYHHAASYANHHPSAQGLPSGGGVGMVDDPRGKEHAHLSNLAREKGDLEKGRKL